PLGRGRKIPLSTFIPTIKSTPSRVVLAHLNQGAAGRRQLQGIPMTERAIETIHHPPMPVDTNETREAEDALITEMCCLNAMPTEAGPMPDRMTASELVEIEL